MIMVSYVERVDACQEEGADMKESIDLFESIQAV